MYTMALTKEEIQKAKELRTRGPKPRFTEEACVKAYIKHGSMREAAEALGCSTVTVLKKVARALEGK